MKNDLRVVISDKIFPCTETDNKGSVMEFYQIMGMNHTDLAYFQGLVSRQARVPFTLCSGSGREDPCMVYIRDVINIEYTRKVLSFDVVIERVRR